MQGTTQSCVTTCVGKELQKQWYRVCSLTHSTAQDSSTASGVSDHPAREGVVGRACEGARLGSVCWSVYPRAGTTLLCLL